MSEMQHYTLRLKALSPIYIGAGDSYGRKSTVFLPRRNCVIVLNMKKLTRLLDSHRLLDDYVKFMQSTDRDLNKWLISGGVAQQEILEAAQYEIDAGDMFRNRNAGGISTLNFFIKDVYHKPYIPGSSVKGAVRSAILAALMERHPRAEEHFQTAIRELDHCMDRNDRFRKLTLQRQSQTLEAEQLHKLILYDEKGTEVEQSNAVLSVMRGLSISDSKPLELSDLILCSREYLYKNGLVKTQNKNSMAWECIRPGTVIEHILTLDPAILEQAKITPQIIIQSVRKFYEIQYHFFLSKFNAESLDKTPARTVLLLGAGTGFASKSFAYPLFGNNGLEYTSKLMAKQFPKHFHDQDMAKGVSPHTLKCARCNGKLYMMGRCEVEITQ